MKKSRIIIDTIVGLISLIMFTIMVKTLINTDLILTINIGYVILAILSYLLLHTVKMIRYYLILSESYMSIYDLSKLYIRFSLVNILIPKKIGEVYKFYAIGEEIGNYKVSFLSIVTQIYFDVIAILFIIIVNLAIFGNVNSFILTLFAAAVIIVSLVYLIFPSSYRYLNSYFIVKTSKKRDVYALDILEQMKSWYKYQKDILKGKGGIILIISFIIWGLEFFTSFFIAKNIGMDYNLDTFARYISNILVFEKNSVNRLLNIYTVAGSIIFVIALLALILVKRWRREKVEV